MEVFKNGDVDAFFPGRLTSDLDFPVAFVTCMLGWLSSQAKLTNRLNRHLPPLSP